MCVRIHFTVAILSKDILLRLTVHATVSASVLFCCLWMFFSGVWDVPGGVSIGSVLGCVYVVSFCFGDDRKEVKTKLSCLTQASISAVCDVPVVFLWCVCCDSVIAVIL